eukprot:TRINITY_DN5581_c1_g1_i1.p3 TRINITY_DN5581_c1_g1~~TRINITY_DN5581_c1_g1_i1.p3  ORF type:complete len:244 (+),score=72.16 TRINITY_DN5581_c1_g1_i1:75-806(+)
MDGLARPLTYTSPHVSPPPPPSSSSPLCYTFGALASHILQDDEQRAFHTALRIPRDRHGAMTLAPRRRRFLTAEEAEGLGFRAMRVSEEVLALRDRAADHRLQQVDAIRKDFFSDMAEPRSRPRVRSARAPGGTGTNLTAGVTPATPFRSGLVEALRPATGDATPLRFPAFQPAAPTPPARPATARPPGGCGKEERGVRWRPALARRRLEQHRVRQEAREARGEPPRVPQIRKWKGRLLTDLL